MKTTVYLVAALAASLAISSPRLRAGEEQTPVQSNPGLTPKAPPLPLHTLEGVGGLFITPMAYLVNPGPAGTVVGLPSASMTFAKANRKNLEAVAVTETLFGRVELGYAPNRFGIWTLRSQVHNEVGVDLGRNDIYMHNINSRVLAVPEGAYGLPLLPAITAGCSLKVNTDFEDFDRKLGGALTRIGLTHATGVDFTVTATKALPLFGRPLLLTVGGRFSQAAHLGYFGFCDTYYALAEGSLAYSVTKWLWIAGEFRENAHPYTPLGDLVRPENNFWTLGAVVILDPHATVTLGYGHLGDLLNTTENTTVAVQFKYEM